MSEVQNIKEKLISVLDDFVGDEVYLQGTFPAGKEYPQKFITFFMTGSQFDSFFDNNANRINWDISVIFYSDDPSEVLSVPPQIVRAMKADGFIPYGVGEDIPSDVITHTGWALEFAYIESYDNTPPASEPETEPTSAAETEN